MQYTPNSCDKTLWSYDYPAVERKQASFRSFHPQLLLDKKLPNKEQHLVMRIYEIYILIDDVHDK